MNPDQTLNREEGRDAEWAERPTSGAGMAGILELSDPLRDIYLALVRLGDLDMTEIQAQIHEDEPDTLPVFVRILVRQGQVERYQDAVGIIRFRAVLADKAKKTLSDDIWAALG